jgi:hypothetical protein
MLQLLTNIDFFGEIHVFLHLSWISLVGANRAHPHLGTPKLQEVFLSKTNSILSWKQGSRWNASNRDGFLWRDTCLSSTQLRRPIWTKWAFLQLENWDFRKYSFPKLTQFCLCYKVLHAVDSNRDGSMETYMCSFNFTKKAFVEQLGHISTLQSVICRKYSFQKVTQFS